MRLIITALVLALSATRIFSAEAGRPAAVEALEKLMVGNQRYIDGKINFLNRDMFRREELVEGQAPLAVIVCCSDSRVPPEIIFDQGLGDTFVVRVAGNVLGLIETESVMYAADALKAPVIMVLGHSNCGAAKAALKGGEAIADMPEIALKFAPALKAKPVGSMPRLEQVIKTNVEYVRDQLRAIPLLAQFVREKRLIIVGGFYDLENGKVSLLKN